MKNTNLIIGAIVLILIIVIVFLLKAHILTSPFNIPSLKLKKEGEIIMMNEEDSSGVRGTAKVSQENGKAKVAINLVGIKPEDDIYMHIHEGSCPDLGEILYDLNTLKEGSSETKLDMSIKDLRKSLPLGINIHKYEGEEEIEIACGNL